RAGARGLAALVAPERDRDAAQLRRLARQRGAPARDLPRQPGALRARRAAAQRSARVNSLAVVLAVLTYNVHGLDAWLVDDDPVARMPQISERLERADTALVQGSS